MTAQRKVQNNNKNETPKLHYIYASINYNRREKNKFIGRQKAKGSVIMSISPPQQRMMKWQSARNGAGRKKQTCIGARETRASGQKMIREPQQRTRKRDEFHRPVKLESKKKYESRENIDQGE